MYNPRKEIFLCRTPSLFPIRTFWVTLPERSVRFILTERFRAFNGNDPSSISR